MARNSLGLKPPSRTQPEKLTSKSLPRRKSMADDSGVQDAAEGLLTGTVSLLRNVGDWRIAAVR